MASCSAMGSDVRDPYRGVCFLGTTIIMAALTAGICSCVQTSQTRCCSNSPCVLNQQSISNCTMMSFILVNIYPPSQRTWQKRSILTPTVVGPPVLSGAPAAPHAPTPTTSSVLSPASASILTSGVMAIPSVHSPRTRVWRSVLRGGSGPSLSLHLAV